MVSSGAPLLSARIALWIMWGPGAKGSVPRWLNRSRKKSNSVFISRDASRDGLRRVPSVACGGDARPRSSDSRLR